ncbi:MAG: transporter substrate-binding domain-containing protein [Candidatus Melainabacteria bacterium]|nr:transporter substrate-binding domain-containing protein [Candidatus Melainabacteria bacterium]
MMDPAATRRPAKVIHPNRSGLGVLRSLAVWALGTLCIGLVGLSISGCGLLTPEDETPLLQRVKARGKMIAGVKYDSKPFGFLTPDNTLQGFDIDLIRELSRRILGDPNAVEFQQVLSSTRILAINSGQMDVVAATMTITPAREEVIDFSQPYFTASQRVLVPRQSAAKKLSDLNGQRILFVFGATSEHNIKKRLNTQTKFIGFKTSTDAFAALKAGRGDALTTDDTILYGFLSTDCNYRLLPERLAEEPYGLGFRQDPQSKSTHSFRTLIDKTLAHMKADGTLAKLRSKWLGPLEAEAQNCQQTASSVQPPLTTNPH